MTLGPAQRSITTIANVTVPLAPTTSSMTSPSNHPRQCRHQHRHRRPAILATINEAANDATSAVTTVIVSLALAAPANTASVSTVHDVHSGEVNDAVPISAIVATMEVSKSWPDFDCPSHQRI